MNAIPFSLFGRIHQYAVVKKKSKDVRVFYYKIPESLVGFINRIGSNWYTNTKYKLIIDGEVVDSNVERVFGSMENPAIIDPPFLVNSYIEVRVDNDDEEDHLFEVFCDGVLYMR